MKIEIPLQFFLVCFLILGVSVFLGAWYLKKAETFVDVKMDGDDYEIQLQACPSGTQSFEYKGTISCCEGDIVNEMCNGRIVCNISEDKAENPSCTTVLRKELRDKGVRFCPSTLPKYFEDTATKLKGCTSGKRTKDGKGPENANEPKCIIYGTYSENKNRIDSCENIKARDSTKCPGGKKAELVSFDSKFPVLIQCGFTTNTQPTPITCYEDTSLLDYLKVAWSNWRGNLSNNTKLLFCSTANEYYMNRSLNESDLNLLDGPYVNPAPRQNCPPRMRKSRDGKTCSPNLGSNRPICYLIRKSGVPPCHCPPGMTSANNGTTCTGGDLPDCKLYGDSKLKFC
jgi:hypothetical protein